MGSKPAGKTGASTIARYFAFRWAYLFLSLILLCVLMSLLFIGNLYYSDAVPWWSPSFLIYSGWPGVIGETAASRLHGFLGLDFDVYGWRTGPAAWWILEPMNLASIAVSVLLIAATALFIIPAQGSAKNLPASRPIPLRGRITAALVNGIIAAALFAGVIETTRFDVVPALDGLGWLTPATQSYYPPPNRFTPTWGIWSMASWLIAFLVALPVALGSLAVGIFWPAPSDRYWQTERRTLIYTLLGLSMIAAASALCDDTPTTTPTTSTSSAGGSASGSSAGGYSAGPGSHVPRSSSCSAGTTSRSPTRRTPPASPAATTSAAASWPSRPSAPSAAPRSRTG